ncbi:hypothetical protein AB0L13_30895 [Saccharopolyspora shandongensis]|uniref:hypothetical protein n=1 Tax=Saccharopolyspora shandongensis TaxID=418495 RepID=UPI003414251A
MPIKPHKHLTSYATSADLVIRRSFGRYPIDDPSKKGQRNEHRGVARQDFAGDRPEF